MALFVNLWLKCLLIVNWSMTPLFFRLWRYGNILSFLDEQLIVEVLRLPHINKWGHILWIGYLFRYRWYTFLLTNLFFRLNDACCLMRLHYLLFWFLLRALFLVFFTCIILCCQKFWQCFRFLPTCSFWHILLWCLW